MTPRCPVLIGAAISNMLQTMGTDQIFLLWVGNKNSPQPTAPGQPGPLLLPHPGDHLSSLYSSMQNRVQEPEPVTVSATGWVCPQGLLVQRLQGHLSHFSNQTPSQHCHRVDNYWLPTMCPPWYTTIQTIIFATNTYMPVAGERGVTPRNAHDGGRSCEQRFGTTSLNPELIWKVRRETVPSRAVQRSRPET